LYHDEFTFVYLTSGSEVVKFPLLKTSLGGTSAFFCSELPSVLIIHGLRSAEETVFFCMGNKRGQKGG
jgi:hypothetical protein